MSYEDASTPISLHVIVLQRQQRGKLPVGFSGAQEVGVKLASNHLSVLCYLLAPPSFSYKLGCHEHILLGKVVESFFTLATRLFAIVNEHVELYVFVRDQLASTLCTRRRLASHILTCKQLTLRVNFIFGDDNGLEPSTSSLLYVVQISGCQLLHFILFLKSLNQHEPIVALKHIVHLRHGRIHDLLQRQEEGRHLNEVTELNVDGQRLQEESNALDVEHFILLTTRHVVQLDLPLEAFDAVFVNGCVYLTNSCFIKDETHFTLIIDEVAWSYNCSVTRLSLRLIIYLQVANLEL